MDTSTESRLLWFVLALAVFVMAVLLLGTLRANYVICDDFEHAGVVTCVDGRNGNVEEN
jgi:hypothetical protein